MSASARDAVSDWLLDKDINITRGSTNDLADNLISALSAAGFVIVPREPTSAMRRAADERRGTGHPHVDIYRAMLSAAEGKK